MYNLILQKNPNIFFVTRSMLFWPACQKFIAKGATKIKKFIFYSKTNSSGRTQRSFASPAESYLLKFREFQLQKGKTNQKVKTSTTLTIGTVRVQFTKPSRKFLLLAARNILVSSENIIFLLENPQFVCRLVFWQAVEIFRSISKKFLLHVKKILA